MYKSSWLIGLLLCSKLLWAHPFHTSLMEIEYNPNNSQLEIAIKLDLVDLEEALTAFSGAQSVLSDDQQSDAVIFNYLQQKLAFYNANADHSKLLPLQWVGKQLELKVAWVYLTVSAPQAQIKLVNRLLLGISSQQLNTVSLIQQGKKQTHQLSRGNSSLIMDFKPRSL